MLKEKMNIYELLDLLEQSDQGMIELSLPDQHEIIKRLELKVDNSKYLLDKMKAESDRLAKYIDEFSKSKRAIDDNIKRIKEFYLMSVKEKGFEKIPGEKFKLSITTTKSIVTEKEPSISDALLYKRYVKTVYSWDRKALKEGLESNDPKALKIAKFKESESLRYSPNRMKIK